MLSVRINGARHEFEEGTVLLRALQTLGISVPAACDDPRLKPAGACRLCLVDIAGTARPATACTTPLQEGMEIRTSTPAIEQLRETNFRLLAARAEGGAGDRAQAREARPGDNLKEISFGSGRPELRDDSHPYIAVDMSRCIFCFRCARICDEVQGQFVWQVWNRGSAIRLVPDSGTTLMESSCTSCGACADSCPTGAIEDKSILRLGTPERWTRTTCPYCGVGCEMMAGTRAGRIVQIKPALDAPVNKGHLCVKGRYAFDFVHSADRIMEPMIREADGWRKASWEEAISFAAKGLARISREQGPDSIGLLGSARGTNEENYLAQKFARVVLGTNNVDCCARVCHAPTAAAMKEMFGTGAATNSFDDIEEAGAFLVCGANVTEAHPVVGARIKQAVLRGAKLIVIDPRKIELARFADIHLPLKPGTNIPLLNAMAAVIVKEQLGDEGTLRDRISGWDEFRGFIGRFTPGRAAEICGVDAGMIEKAARMYATTKPAMCFHGLGATEHTQGTEGVACLVNLALLTGNFGKPGSGLNPLRGQNNVQGSAHMGCEPGKLTGFVPIEEGRGLFETTWGAALPRGRGLNLMEMLDAAREGKLKAIWAIGYDVAHTNPNRAATRQSLEKLELVIVQDLFMNEVGREFGHVFLPACSSYEKEGTFMNAERRVQRVRQVIKAAGESRTDWQIICAVAGAMGFGAQFAFGCAEEIWNEVREVWKAGAGISYARLDNRGLQWPCPDEAHPGTRILHAEAFAHGPRAPLRRVEYSPTPELANDEFPFLLTTGRALQQFNAGTMTMRTQNVLLRETDMLDMAPSDAARLRLTAGERVRVRSRHGEAVMPVKLDDRVKPGELFATFHDPEAGLNNLTSPYRDGVVMTPEYKVVAAAIDLIEQGPRAPRTVERRPAERETAEEVGVPAEGLE